MKCIVFCIPGASVSNRGLSCWTKLFLTCHLWGYYPRLKTSAGAYIYHTRNACLDGSRHGSTTQKPFNGALKYDYLMWLDNDLVYEPRDVKMLLDYLDTHPSMSILSGTYARDAQIKTLVGAFDDRRLTPEDLNKYSLPFKVATCALGFCLVRFGVFEKLDFPWFEPLGYTDSQKNIRSFTGEDVAFCFKARKIGFTSYIHPKCLVGHEKFLVIR